MRKFGLIILFFSILIITGCQKNKLGGDERLTKHEKEIFNIQSVNNSCVPFSLVIYENGEYELFTKYESCKYDENCTSELKYTKSIKGKYNYDVMKIIDNSTKANDNGYTNDNLPLYQIYMSDGYVKKGYQYNYTVEKNQSNKYLEEFLNEIDIELETCAEQEYK